MRRGRALPAVVLAIAATSGAPAAAAPVVSPATVEVVHGGFATLYLKDPRQGSLWIHVATTHTPKGPSTEVTYVRQRPCYTEGRRVKLVLCPIGWTVRGTAPPGSFTYDATLGTATLTGSVADLPVRVTWQGYGDTSRQVNENGNVLVELRDADGDMRWGGHRFTDTPGSWVGTQLYRRVTARPR